MSSSESNYPFEHLLQRRFRIGDHLVQPDSNCIINGDLRTHLEPKAMEVLVFLASCSGETVSRERLMSAFWSDTYVTDDALNQSIRKIRRAFRKGADETRIISTVPKKGYRLVAPVSVEPRKREDNLAAAPPSRAGAEDSAATGREKRRARRLSPALALSTAAIAIGLGWLLRSLVPGGAAYGAGALVPIQLAAPMCHERCTSISPSGEETAFEHIAASGYRMNQSDIFIQRSPGNPWIFAGSASHHEVAPAWAPDGRGIAFARFPIQGGPCEIIYKSVKTSQERSLASCGAQSAAPLGWHPHLAWAPDGKGLLFSGRPKVAAEDCEHSGVRIYQLLLAGGELRAISCPPSGSLGDTEIAVSPNGRWIAFVRAISAVGQDIYVQPLEGGKARRITFENRPVQNLRWTKDGESILFNSRRTVGAAFDWPPR